MEKIQSQNVEALRAEIFNYIYTKHYDVRMIWLVHIEALIFRKIMIRITFNRRVQPSKHQKSKRKDTVSNNCTSSGKYVIITVIVTEPEETAAMHK